MYDVINIKTKEDPFNLNNVFAENTDVTLFTEYVFENGKAQVKVLVDDIQKIKDLLTQEIESQDRSILDNTKVDGKKSKIDAKKVKFFDPVKFWKSKLLKDLEDDISSIFGFRSVQIQPYIEKYNSAEKQFESKIMNCEIWHVDRFPIDGLVTEKGFYDKTKSIVLNIFVSLGLLNELTSEEVLAVLLHEFGHSIDPALVDIKYVETNILSKYLTDRKNSINKTENRLLKNIKDKFKSVPTFLAVLPKATANQFLGIFMNKDKRMKKMLDDIEKTLNKDISDFNRQEFGEAFADNFARMYGYGPQLVSGLAKMDKDRDRELKSRFKKEKLRQAAIISITKSMINDVHKTNIHRINALIKEYKIDIKDPNTSPKVKKQLEDDLHELELVLDQYLNHEDELQKRINILINEKLNEEK